MRYMHWGPHQYYREATPSLVEQILKVMTRRRPGQ